jgi:hypothetical protein
MNDEEYAALGGNGWTVKTVKELVQSLMKEVDLRYEKEFKFQTEARDAADLRYEQRFLAQETALATALANEKEARRTALDAVERGNTKAETAAEKRFEALSEKLDLLQSSYANSSGIFSGAEDKSKILTGRIMAIIAILVSISAVLIMLFHR